MPAYVSSFLRPEIVLLSYDLGGKGNDPNRETVEFLRPLLKPDDEILCNYEDIPLMFYLPNRIRGGISCFRVTDAGEVSFMTFRRSWKAHFPVYPQVIEKSQWRSYSLNAPDIPFGNFPDPRAHFAIGILSARAEPLKIFKRVEQ